MSTKASRDTSRREFLGSAASFALGCAIAGPARAAMGPDDKFDLVIKGGDVLDPSQSLRGKRDIGIRYGVDRGDGGRHSRGARVARPRCRRQAGDAGAHRSAHATSIPMARRSAFRPTSWSRINARRPACRRAMPAPTTSRPSAATSSRRRAPASTPSCTSPIWGWRRSRSPSSTTSTSRKSTRLRKRGRRERRHGVRRQGAHVGERDRQEWHRAAQARDRGLREGRHRRQGDVPHRRRRDARADVADPRPAAGRRHPHPLPIPAPRTSPATSPTSSRTASCLPAALAAKQRGVIFDVGHGGGSFDFTVAEAAIAQGCPPDTISSDIHVFSGNTPGMPYLTWVMSKFMALGFSLDQVVAMATINPAKVINRLPKLGTLQVGAPGDVAIMELVEGPVSFVDTRNNKRDGKALSQAGADRDRRRAVRPTVQCAVRGQVSGTHVRHQKRIQPGTSQSVPHQGRTSHADPTRYPRICRRRDRGCRGRTQGVRGLGAERALSGSRGPDPRSELRQVSPGARRRRAARHRHALVRGAGLFRRLRAACCGAISPTTASCAGTRRPARQRLSASPPTMPTAIPATGRAGSSPASTTRGA